MSEGGTGTPNQAGGSPEGGWSSGSTGNPVPGQLSGQAIPNQLSTPGAPAGPGPLGGPGGPGAPGEMPSAPAPAPKKGFAINGLVLRVGIIGLVLVGAFLLRDRLPGAAQDLAVGDCFDEPNGGVATEVTDVPHKPCTEAHDAEIFFVGDHPSSDTYPGAAAFETYIATNCIPAFETYIGRDYQTDTEFDFGYFYPLSSGWTSGDHEISCYAYRLDKAKLTKSIKAGAS